MHRLFCAFGIFLLGLGCQVGAERQSVSGAETETDQNRRSVEIIVKLRRPKKGAPKKARRSAVSVGGQRYTVTRRRPAFSLPTLKSSPATNSTLKNATRAPQRSAEDLGLDRIEVWTLDEPKAGELTAIIDALNDDADIEYAETSAIFYAFSTPNDPLFPEQVGLDADKSTGAAYNPDIEFLAGFQSPNYGHGEGVVVAVIDSGVDYTHSDIANNIWENEGETGQDANGADRRSNGVDDDGNGKIDDFRGWDFVRSEKKEDGVDDRGPDNDPADRSGHGTHVAGIIAAEANNGIGIVGVSPKAKVMALRGLGITGQGTTPDLAESIVYAVENGARIINASWGYSGVSPRIMDDAIEFARVNNVIFVAAAGNKDQPVDDFVPANIPSVISVGAFRPRSRDKATFSNWGSDIDITAPGVSVLSLLAEGSAYEKQKKNAIVDDKYLRLDGTSMAAPHVSGALAGLISSLTEAKARNRIGPASARQLLQSSRLNSVFALGLASPAPYHSRELGAGRLSLKNLLEMASTRLSMAELSVREPNSKESAPHLTVHLEPDSYDEWSLYVSKIESIGSLWRSPCDIVTEGCIINPVAVRYLSENDPYTVELRTEKSGRINGRSALSFVFDFLKIWQPPTEASAVYNGSERLTFNYSVLDGRGTDGSNMGYTYEVTLESYLHGETRVLVNNQESSGFLEKGLVLDLETLGPKSDRYDLVLRVEYSNGKVSTERTSIYVDFDLRPHSPLMVPGAFELATLSPLLLLPPKPGLMTSKTIYQSLPRCTRNEKKGTIECPLTSELVRTSLEGRRTVLGESLHLREDVVGGSYRKIVGMAGSGAELALKLRNHTVANLSGPWFTPAPWSMVRLDAPDFFIASATGHAKNASPRSDKEILVADLDGDGGSETVTTHIEVDETKPSRSYVTSLEVLDAAGNHQFSRTLTASSGSLGNPIIALAELDGVAHTKEIIVATHYREDNRTMLQLDAVTKEDVLLWSKRVDLDAEGLKIIPTRYTRSARLFSVDIDGDGLDEIGLFHQSASGKREFVLDIYDMKGQSASRITFPTDKGSSAFLSFALGDLDEDGRVDIAVGSGSVLAAFRLDTGQPIWQLTDFSWDDSSPLAENIMRVLMADFDSDGHQELLVLVSGRHPPPNRGAVLDYQLRLIDRRGRELQTPHFPKIYPLPLRTLLSDGSVRTDVLAPQPEVILIDDVDYDGKLDLIMNFYSTRTDRTGTQSLLTFVSSVEGDAQSPYFSGAHRFNASRTARHVTAPTTVYEDAESQRTSRWSIYSGDKDQTTLSNVYDEERGSRVIEIGPASSRLKYGFALPSIEHSWENQHQFVMEWTTKLVGDYRIFVRVRTNKGATRYLWYSPVDENLQGTNARYIHHGLGRSSGSKWQTCFRDLRQDLEDGGQTDPDEIIVSVQGFLIRGNGRLDDIKLHSHLPAGAVLGCTD